MNISPWQMYLLTRLDGVHKATDLVATMSIVSLIALMLFMLFVGEDWLDACEAKPDKVVKRLAIMFACTMALSLLLPTSKEMAAIWVLPRIANSQTVSELGDATVALAKQWLEELKPKQGGKEGAK